MGFKMGRRVMLLVVMMAVYCAVNMVECYDKEGWSRGGEEEEEEEGRSREGYDEIFLMRDSKRVFQTEAGEMRVTMKNGVWGVGLVPEKKRMHIGFITMEPKSLFIPQYLDSTLILFIRQGEARIGLIYKDDFVEKNVTRGDVYRIPAGSTFYIENSGEGQRLQIICSIDLSETLHLGTFQSYFIGGGLNPTSILAGFDRFTLSVALNVSLSVVDEIFTSKLKGPIIYITAPEPELEPEIEEEPEDERQPELSTWSRFFKLGHQDRMRAMTRFVNVVGLDTHEELTEPTWYEKLSRLVFGAGSGFENDRSVRGKTKAPDSYNLYKRKPDFENDHGYSVAVDGGDYNPLSKSDIGLFLVKLHAGAMLAPHLNPLAEEVTIVLNGTGTVEVGYPNGTRAMKAIVREGDVFFIPQFYPFCQIASRSGPFEFFGFTTSARKNRPQFLAGAGSIFRTMAGPQMAAGLGMFLERYNKIMGAQNQTIIFSATPASPGE